MVIKYNRVSTINQTGSRFSLDKNTYDEVFLDKVSGSVPFKERPYGSKVHTLVQEGRVETLVVEELSRLGRSTGDVIATTEWLDEHEVNVVVRNLGIQSRPEGIRNPVWKILISVMSSLYYMEKEHIKERTHTGRMVYQQRGGKLGRPVGSKESHRDFLNKRKTKEIISLMERGMSYGEIQTLVKCSPGTIRKVKTILSVTRDS